MLLSKENKKFPTLQLKNKNCCHSVTKLPIVAISIVAKPKKRNVSCQEYINSDDFDPKGIAIWYPDGHTEFFQDIRVAIARLQVLYGKNLERVRVVTHDPEQWELYYLKHKFGVIPANVTDTAALSRLLHSPAVSTELPDVARRYGTQYSEPVSQDPAVMEEQARAKVKAIAELADKMLAEAPPMEIDIIQHTIMMFLKAEFRIAYEAIEEAAAVFEEYVENSLMVSGYDKRAITNDNIFCRVMNDTMTKTGRQFSIDGKPVYKAVSKAVETLNLCDDSDHEVAELSRLRLLTRDAKYVLPKMKHLVETAKLTNNVLPASLQYHQAQTGRFAGGNGFNVQGIPGSAVTLKATRTAIEVLRRSIKAPDGKTFVAVDACQIEPRTLAYLCGQTEIINAFASGIDIYSEFASEVFGEEVKKTDDTRMHALRQIGKKAIISLGYQTGVKHFAKELRKMPECIPLFEDGTLSDKVCAEIVYGYREANAKIADFWAGSEAAFIEAYDNGVAEYLGMKYIRDNSNIKIELSSGRKLVYSKVKVSAPQRQGLSFIGYNGEKIHRSTTRRRISYGNDKNLYGGKLVENIVQAVSRDIMVEAILKLEQQGYPVVMHVHDEIICSVEDSKAEECLLAMVQAWRGVPEWMGGLVLDAEGKVGRNFLEIK